MTNDEVAYDIAVTMLEVIDHHMTKGLPAEVILDGVADSFVILMSAIELRQGAITH